MTQPLPRPTVDATIHALEGVQRLTFMDRPDLHREVAEVLSALYEYRVYLAGGEIEVSPLPLCELPDCHYRETGKHYHAVVKIVE